MKDSPTDSPSVLTEQSTTAGALLRFLEWMATVAEVLAVGLLLLLLTSVFVMVVARNIFNVGLAWLDDLARYLQIWVVYTIAVSLTLKGDHITMDALYIRLPPSWRLMIRRLWSLTSLAVCALTGYLALEQAIQVVGRAEVSSTGVLPAILGYASLPFGFCLMAAAGLYYFLHGSRVE